jgi:hypothetical protein
VPGWLYRIGLCYTFTVRSASSVAAAVKRAAVHANAAPYCIAASCGIDLYASLYPDTPPHVEALSRHPARNIRARAGSRDIDVRIGDIKTGDGQSSRDTDPNPVSQSSNFLN